MLRTLIHAFRLALRGLLRRTMPVTVRDTISLQRELARRELEPAMAEPPVGRRILVLAPHMDDEVFGCGGMLARAAAAGSSVRVAFITDGSRGYDAAYVGVPERERASFERSLVSRRKEESRRAGGLLGFGEPVFLDLPDGRASGAAGAAETLARVMRDLSPDVICLPFLTDPHPDHWATNRLFAEASALAELPPAVECWGYEVWMPLAANTFVDITSVMELKHSAMRVFESQNNPVDYPRAVAALNAYRSLAAGVRHGYVEAYYVDTVDGYCDLFRRTWPRAGH